ncbi:MAG: hypothetical protein V5A39_13050 [Haloarculaceae archaeon]
MTSDVPESTRRYARENREQLEYILRHGSSIEIRAYAAALLIRGLPDPEVQQVIDELETGREVLS